MNQNRTYLEPQIAPKYRRDMRGAAACLLAIPIVWLGLVSVTHAGNGGHSLNGQQHGSGGPPCGGCKGGGVGNSGSWSAITGNGGGWSWGSLFGNSPSVNKTNGFGSAGSGTSGKSSVTGTHEGPIRK